MTAPKFCGYCGRALKERVGGYGDSLWLTCPKSWKMSFFNYILFDRGYKHTDLYLDKYEGSKNYDPQTGEKINA